MCLQEFYFFCLFLFLKKVKRDIPTLIYKKIRLAKLFIITLFKLLKDLVLFIQKKKKRERFSIGYTCFWKQEFIGSNLNSKIDTFGNDRSF